MKTCVRILLPLTLSIALGACSGIKRPQSADNAAPFTQEKGQKATTMAVSPKTQEKTMELSGTLSVRGGGKMTHLQLDTSRGSYQISNPQDFGLQHMQNHHVTLKARLIQKAIGPGFPARIKVLSVVKAP